MPDAGATISWTPSSDPNADAQDVYIDTVNPAQFAVLTDAPMSTSTASRSDFANAGETIYYRIVTKDTSANEEAEVTGVVGTVGSDVAAGVLPGGGESTLPAALDEGQVFLVTDNDNTSAIPFPRLYAGPNGGGAPVPLAVPTDKTFGYAQSVSVAAGSDVTLVDLDTYTGIRSRIGGQLVRRDSDNQILWQNPSLGDTSGFSGYDVATGMYGHILAVNDSGDGSAVVIPIDFSSALVDAPISSYALPDGTYDFHVYIEDAIL